MSSRKRKAVKVIYQGDRRREELEAELFGGGSVFRSEEDDDGVFIIADELKKTTSSRVSCVVLIQL